MEDEALSPTLAALTGSAPLRPGDVLGDRYQLRAQLGRGGMGVVWQALDRDLDEDVALKLLDPNVPLTVDAAIRFRREVKLARRVTHPNVARTYDLGRHQGIHFFTMELIAGESLGARSKTPLALSETLRIAAEVCRGLAAAHAQGVVHRDLKPDNVMLAGERVVITDFGIARSDGDVLATSGAIVGTPAYMAPEQLDNRGIDGRADVYALGVLLFEAITGTLPFHGETPFAMAAARIGATPPDPRSIATGIPDAVAALVLQALSPRREDRPDAQVVATRLDVIRSGGAAPRRLAAPAVLSSLDLAIGTGSTRTIVVEPIAARAELAALAADLSSSISDAIARERRLRVGDAGGDLVLSGELRTEGDRARVRLRIRSRDGATRWSGRAEGLVSQPFALEDAAVEQATSAVRLHGVPRQGPSDEALRPRFEEARALVGEVDPNAFRQALVILEELARHAPNEPSIQSLLALALTHGVMTTRTMAPDSATRAEALALRALEADPDLLDAYVAIAAIRRSHGDYSAALQSVRQALARSPAFGAAHHTLGRFLCESGNVDEGLPRLELAEQLGHRSGLALSMTLRIRALLGQQDLVRAELARIRGTSLERSLLPVLGELCLWWNDHALAEEVATGIESNRSGAWWDHFSPILRAFARGEDHSVPLDEVMQPLATGRTTSWVRSRAGMYRSICYAQVGRIDDALGALGNLAEEVTFIELLWLDRVPPLAVLRAHPRFAEARARVASRVAAITL